VDLDLTTLILQTLNVLILIWVLQKFLYRPILAVLDRRREELAAEQATLKSQADALTQQREQLGADRATLVHDREQLLGDAQQQARDLGDKLRAQYHAEAEKLLSDARQQIGREREQALVAVQDKLTDLAEALLRRMLEQLPRREWFLYYLEQLAAALPVLNVQGRVTVVTAEPLDDALRGRVTERLAAKLPGVTDWQFSENAELLAGLELHLPDGVLRHHARQDLARLHAALRASAPPEAADPAHGVVNG